MSTPGRKIRKLKWAFSNRVVAEEISVSQVGYFAPRAFVNIGGHLRRVHSVDNARLVLRVY